MTFGRNRGMFISRSIHQRTLILTHTHNKPGAPAGYASRDCPVALATKYPCELPVAGHRGVVRMIPDMNVWGMIRSLWILWVITALFVFAPSAQALDPIEEQYVFVNTATGLAWTADFSGIAGVGFGLSSVRGGSSNRVDLQFTYAYSPLDVISDLNSRIEGGVNIFSLGVDYNSYTTPEYTFLGQYFTVGLAYNNMSWGYKEAVEIEGTTVTRDALSGIELYFGAGLVIQQWDGVVLYGEVMPGYIVWLGGSNRGFDRASFDQFYNIKLNIGAAFQIR
ncbi:hypothetical protein BMS3Bbin04_01128 [bacterium BMS3Bbin04]|nr:hypothetical protein BMS3Bbin04_01128 [bacterium BMS3Bbin04]